MAIARDICIICEKPFISISHHNCLMRVPSIKKNIKTTPISKAINERMNRNLNAWIQRDENLFIAQSYDKIKIWQ